MANTDRVFTTVTFEGRQTVEDIQRRFRSELSEIEILKATSKAINITAYRTQNFIKKEIKSQYTINKKYLDRSSKIATRAKSAVNGLYAHVTFSYQTVPLIGFNHSQRQTRSGSNRGISSRVKDERKSWKHAFIAKMSGISNKGEHYEHEGIFAAGHYSKGTFIPEKRLTRAQANHPRSVGGKNKITELKGPSVFTMSTNAVTRERVNTYVSNQLPKRVEAFIKNAVKKLTR
jgi:hypothetical protein